MMPSNTNHSNRKRHCCTSGNGKNNNDDNSRSTGKAEQRSACLILVAFAACIQLFISMAAGNLDPYLQQPSLDYSNNVSSSLVSASAALFTTPTSSSPSPTLSSHVEGKGSIAVSGQHNGNETEILLGRDPDKDKNQLQYQEATTINADAPIIKPWNENDVKVAIYMTTHYSKIHQEFLEECWPAATERLKFLQQADLIVYTSANLTREMLSNLTFRNITIRRHESNEIMNDKQDGARKAMLDPFESHHRWFDPYDWIVRLNPDVLIRDDSWLLEAVQNVSLDLIYVNCSLRNLLHTDFTAFRPKAVDEAALFHNYETELNAERHLTASFQKIVESKRIAHLPGANVTGRHCRVCGRYSPVIHMHRFADFCPDYFDVHAIAEARLPY